MLVTKAEVAARAAYIGYSQHDLDDTRSQSTVPTDGDAGAVNNAKSVHSPGHRSTSVGLNSDKMSPAAVLSPNLAMSPTAGEAVSIGARDRRRAGGGGSVAKSLDRWGSNSLDSDENWSEIADAVVRGSSNGIEAFLLPEEEQVRDMDDQDICYGRGTDWFTIQKRQFDTRQMSTPHFRFRPWNSAHVLLCEDPTYRIFVFLPEVSSEKICRKFGRRQPDYFRKKKKNNPRRSDVGMGM